MKVIRLNKEKLSEKNDFYSKSWKQFNKERGYSYDVHKYDAIALEKEKIVGHGNLKIIGGTAYMGELIINKNDRGKGVGKMLLEHLQEYARKKGCHQFYLETSEKHTEAIEFYKKNGFQIISTMPNHKFGFTWYIFSKELKK